MLAGNQISVTEKNLICFKGSRRSYQASQLPESGGMKCRESVIASKAIVIWKPACMRRGLQIQSAEKKISEFSKSYFELNFGFCQKGHIKVCWCRVR